MVGAGREFPHGADGRGVVGDAGQRLYDRIKPAFLDIGAAIEDLNAFRDAPVGTLRINAAKSAARLVLLPIVARFLATYPGVRVELTIDDALVDVVSEGFDAGVRFGEIIAGDMIATAIGPRQRSAVVATPAFFEQHPLPRVPQDLLGLPCIRYRFPSGAPYRWEFERDGTPIEIEVEGPLMLADWDMTIDAALAGAGVAYVFEGIAEPFLADRRLVRVLEDWCPAYPGFFLYYPSRRQLSAALRAFIEFARRG
ncbi:LysR family transcriptional regulator [Aliidongia dinghuensis]|uniref:LysR family transcriptional regulator n=1 Tax=Aliidongia dinghuensis TaxID=1867774 RepID=A0A8J2YR50_9PROT|nr:LysR substrate-binding domain-containing protein [Aliidongia dinghuensis]GGF07840.1 LysR family transcriptional regulator [Aliidongia dinghuensis]